MITNLLMAAALLAAVLGGGGLVRLVIRRRTDRLLGTVTERPAALPTVLYFTSESCAPCRFQQAPALAQLHERLGDRFSLRTVDVAEDIEAARRYGVLSAPTTVIIDSHGAVRAINVGVASAETLQAQIG